MTDEDPRLTYFVAVLGKIGELERAVEALPAQVREALDPALQTALKAQRQRLADEVNRELEQFRAVLAPFRQALQDLHDRLGPLERATERAQADFDDLLEAMAKRGFFMGVFMAMASILLYEMLR